MNRKQTDDLYMDIAIRISKESNAKRLQVGAILVKDGQIVIGVNGTPSGWDNNCETMNGNGQLKTKPEVIHAESNLASKLMKSPINSTGATVYVTHACCIDCAKILYQAGVERVVYGQNYKSTDGMEFLKKCDIEVDKWNP